MKSVAEGERLIANIHEDEFEPFINDRGQQDGWVLQVNRSKPPGTGFHIYRMDPGYTTLPHEHLGAEEFYVISGDATDNDGTVYRPGDLVMMKSGTQHTTYSENGCTVVCYLPDSKSVDPSD